MHRSTPVNTYQRIRTLYDLGYIERLLSSDDRLRHQPAVYFLSKKGYDALKTAGIAKLQPWSVYARSLQKSSGNISIRILSQAALNHFIDLLGETADLHPEQLLLTAQRSRALSPLPHALLTIKPHRPHRSYLVDVVSARGQHLRQYRRLKNHLHLICGEESGLEGLIIVFDNRYSLKSYRRLLVQELFGYDALSASRIRLVSLDSLLQSDSGDPILEPLNPYAHRLICLKDL